MDLVSIIIPNYNRENLVVETVQNMLDQDYPAKEIIVIDDGSTDNSIARLQAFGDSIQLVTQANQGPGAARNHGLQLAKGKYIQFMDNDDLASLNKISTQVARLEREQADVVYSPWAKFEIDTPSISITGPVLQTKEIPYPSILPSLLRYWSTVLQTFLFRREFLDSIGPFKTDVSYLEDIEYFVRIILKKPVIAFENSPIILYRNNSAEKLSATGDNIIKKSKAEAVFYNAFISHLKNQVPSLYRQLERRIVHNVAIVCYHLKDHPETFQHLEHIKALESKFPLPWQISTIKKLRQYKDGLKHRIFGSRYNRSFYPKPLNDHQRSLIQELGFTEIGTTQS